jgi:2-polyprenyl-3-methyl-5-hydroxy-6-metoxy-1,4-benzoquinol methylase
MPSQPALGAEVDAALAKIMSAHGVKGNVREFHAAVNVAFHEFESVTYDAEHADMWQSLPEQFRLLTEDTARSIGRLMEPIRLLDVGCGTGLATDLLFGTAIGPRIESVCLLDTSPAMLERAKARSSQWKCPVTLHRGLLDSLDRGCRYDWIITCSVLHHVPDLEAFTRCVSELLTPGGVFLHIQDPNGDYLSDAGLAGRMAGMRPVMPEWTQRFTPRRIVRKIQRIISGSPADDIVAKTSRALIDRGILHRPFSAQELFSITDIHVLNERGISIDSIGKWRPEWDLVSKRSYGFFGQMPSALPPKYRKLEGEMIRSGAPNGYHIGAAWRARP